MSTREPVGAEVGAEGGLRASVSLLRRNRDFRRLFLASLISLGGDWFLAVPLFGLALHLKHSPLAVSLILVAQELPFFLMSPIGGHLADRLDRRRLMVSADLVRAVLCVGFLLVRDANTLWIAYPLLAVISAFSAAFDPASSAAMPNLVESEDLATANALAGSTWGTMLAVGAALGGLVAAAFGRDAAFLVDAVSFAISGAMIWRIRRPFAEPQPDQNPGIVQAIAETARYAKKDHRVLALLAVKAGFGVGAGVLVLVSVFAQKVFHAGDLGIGILMSARGIGALVGPFVGRALLGNNDRRLFATIGLALGTFGVAYALLGFAPSLLLAMPIVAIAHVGGGAQWTLSSYGLQRMVPDRIRGRIFAFDNALTTFTLTLSFLATGWAADRWGPRPTAVGLGIVAICWALTWTWLTTDVRRATMLEGCDSAPEVDASI